MEEEDTSTDNPIQEEYNKLAKQYSDWDMGNPTTFTSRVMSMTPNEIEILIHCHVTPEPHPRSDALAVIEALKRFEKHGIIERLSNNRIDMPNFYYTTTDKGNALVSLLCNTQFPTHAWVDKNGKVIKIERG